MKKQWMLNQIKKRWFIPVAALIVIMLFSGIGLAANVIIVHFQGGVGVNGTIHVKAPPPTANDIEIISTPDFTFNSGQIDIIDGVIVVQNNSAYDLTLTLITFDIQSVTWIGAFSYDLSKVPVLKAHSQHSVPVSFNPAQLASSGDFAYSGDLTYSW